jgi:hypothetical protein
VQALVECLNCGDTRPARQDVVRHVAGADSCRRCGYVGWAPTEALTEAARRQLRERPLGRRRLLTVA